MTTIRSEARLQQSLNDVPRLLDKHRVLETLAHRQERPKRVLLESLQHRQNLAELGRRVRAMHGADLAFELESPDRQAFEESIHYGEDLVDRWPLLATLMPIIATIGGNTGNQTMAIMHPRVGRGAGETRGRVAGAEQGPNGAFLGVAIPRGLHATGRDPAYDSSVADVRHRRDGILPGPRSRQRDFVLMVRLKPDTTVFDGSPTAPQRGRRRA